MNRHRDKRAAFVLALLLVFVFVLGQARRADSDRRIDPGTASESGYVAGRTTSALHD